MSVRKKIAIGVAVAILAVLIWLIPNLVERPNFVPTAGKIIYVSDLGSPGYTHIWISNPDGTQATQLTKGDEHDASPAFSPSGSQIVYISDRTGTPQVWVMDADGKSANAITFGSDSTADPQFSPDGVHISYLRRGTLMVTTTKGADTDAVLPPPPASDTDPTKRPVQAVLSYAWQPLQPGNADPGIAAVISNGDNTGALDGTQELFYLPSTAGTGIKHLAVGQQISCAWLPDGSTIEGAVIGVEMLNPGSKVTLPPGADMMPLPKGKSYSAILPFSTADGGLIAGSTAPPGFLPGGTAGPQNPQVSPDGTKVAFEAWPSASPDPSEIQGILLQGLDGSPPQWIAQKIPVTDFRWSTDGSQFSLVAPVRGKPMDSDIIVANPSAGTSQNLTKGTAHASDVVWSPQKSKAS